MMDSHKFNSLYETVPQIWKRHYIFSNVKSINLEQKYIAE